MFIFFPFTSFSSSLCCFFLFSPLEKKKHKLVTLETRQIAPKRTITKEHQLKLNLKYVHWRTVHLAVPLEQPWPWLTKEMSHLCDVVRQCRCVIHLHRRHACVSKSSPFSPSPITGVSTADGGGGGVLWCIHPSSSNNYRGQIKTTLSEALLFLSEDFWLNLDQTSTQRLSLCYTGSFAGCDSHPEF